MAIVLTTGGKNISLNYITGKTSSTEGLLLKLFSNNVTPSEIDTVLTYTEVTGGGYTYKTLTPSTWSVAGGSANYPAQTFTFTGAVGNVYGYYVVRATTGDLVFAERFATGPFNVQTNGDNISVTLNLTAS